MFSKKDSDTSQVNQLPTAQLHPNNEPSIAVLLPCYNEEVAITKVVQDFQSALPNATIYVYDNNSSDNTIEVANKAGATVYSENRQGKGHVVRRMFADIEADIYIMVDGDDTYDPSAVQSMIERLRNEQLDMIVGSRDAKDGAHRIGHALGNKLFNFVVAKLFGNVFSDIFSGYRVFSRRFVKSFPALSKGFDIETELTVHALELHMPVADMPTAFKERPEGSVSKLRTFKDGFRILLRIIVLLKETKPLYFFSFFASLFAAASLYLGLPVVQEYWETGLVPRFPTAILSASIMLMAFLSFVCGTILDSVSRRAKENKRLHYLSYQAVRPIDSNT